MFISKARPLVVPQSEHLHLSGTLALLWGNGDFDAPPFDPLSVVTGVGQHDRGYGVLDNSPIGRMEEAEWLAIARRGFEMQSADPVADLIARYHIRRLARHGDTPERIALSAEFGDLLARQVESGRYSQELFERMDRITELCDRISFAFCFEEPESGRVEIYPRNAREATEAVEFRVAGPEISVNPWPFAVREYSGYITGYLLDGYPGELKPVVLPYRLSRESR
jgi:Protein of unknown function (DUF3891)